MFLYGKYNFDISNRYKVIFPLVNVPYRILLLKVIKNTTIRVYTSVIVISTLTFFYGQVIIWFTRDPVYNVSIFNRSLIRIFVTKINIRVKSEVFKIVDWNH